MKAEWMKWMAALAVVAMWGIGCRLNVSGGGDTDDGTSLPGSVDGDFSDDPVSPGGDPDDDDGGSDDGGDDVDDGGVELPSEQTQSFFTAFQIDPVREDTAGPKFVAAGDVNQDGLLDLASAWNQSQPVQLHLQQRGAFGEISFRTITIAGTAPVAIMAGLEFAQIDGDGWLDIVVLVKATGAGAWCPSVPPKEISRMEGEIIIYFNPASEGLIADGDSWVEMLLVNPYVGDRWFHRHFPGGETIALEDAKVQPEFGGYTALAVGNVDGRPGDDIVVANNAGECLELGQEPALNTVELWVNPGGEDARDPTLWGVPSDRQLSGGVPITLMRDIPQVTDVVIEDIDDDFDLDVVAAYYDSISRNLRWSRNPLLPHGYEAMIAGASDGDIDRCEGGVNDEMGCPNGDADCLGAEDGECWNGSCVGGASPGADCQDSSGCSGVEDGVCRASSWRFYPFHWQNRPIGQVDTHANVMAIGDVDGDSFEDIVVRSTNGKIVQWFRRPNPLTVEPEFPPDDPVPDRFDFPWPVFTITEFLDREPEGIAVGDVTGDGQLELLVAVNGGVYWYDATAGTSVYDPWFGFTIIQDAPADSGGTAGAGGQQGGVGVGVGATDATTFINSLLVVDLDGDGKNDVIGTLDRRSGSGLSDDRLVWYRNVKTD